MRTEPTLNSEPSSAIAGLGHVLPKKTRRPRYHKIKNPTPALVGQCTLKQVLVKKPRSPRYNKDLQLTALVSHCWTQEYAGREAEKRSRQRQQPAYQFASKEAEWRTPRNGTLPYGDQGTGAQVQLERSIPFIHTDTLVFASMEQIGHDCQEGCQARAELNRYHRRLARQELRVSFNRRPDMQLERPCIYSSTRPNNSIFADLGQVLQVCQRVARLWPN
jgi:hypothetical protein